MRKFAFSLALVGVLAFSGAALAEIGTIDDVPAATLLLPYFEVDLSSASGITTLFSINNASAAAAIAHVTLWTDMSMPTFDFDVYLTGYDVQTINVRDLFTFVVPGGVGVPVTGDRGVDAGFGDTLSPSPPLGAGQAANVNPDLGPFTPGVPTEFDFPGTSGPCASPYSSGENVPQSIVDNLVLAHTGQLATIGGISACWGGDHGDQTVRGYITIDNVVQCNLSFPSDATYQTTFASNRNQLWGDYFYVNDGQNFAQGETLVHIEACATATAPGLGSGPSVGIPGGNATVLCPFDFAVGDYTFYGRYVAAPQFAGQDQREPLATTFGVRYLSGGSFTGGTDLIVWRDAKVVDVNGFTCAAGGPAWFPLNQNDIVAFDEQENPEDRCFTGDIFSPPTGGAQTCLPLEAGRYDVDTGNALSTPINPTPNFGWLYLNLNTTQANVPFNGFNQAWVTAVMDAQGRFSVGFDAIKLDSASNPTNIFFAP